MTIGKTLLNFNMGQFLHANVTNKNRQEYSMFPVTQGSRNVDHDFLSCSFHSIKSYMGASVSKPILHD